MLLWQAIDTTMLGLPAIILGMFAWQIVASHAVNSYVRDCALAKLRVCILCCHLCCLAHPQ